MTHFLTILGVIAAVLLILATGLGFLLFLWEVGRND